MTTRNSSNTNSVFMTDFAATDRRSAKAHLQGKNLRVKAFMAFSTMANLVGRGDRAAEDFKMASRFFFKRRESFRRAGKTAAQYATAAVGLVAGAMLYYYLVM